MRVGILAILPLLSASVACRDGSEVPQKPSSSKNVEMKQPEDERFVPPADGRLEAEHVEMYIAVQLRVLELAGRQLEAEASTAVEKLADLATADLRACEELGYDADEYQWVKEKMIEADLGMTAASLDSPMKAIERASLEGLENLRGETKSREEPARLDEQVAGETTDKRTALLRNRELLEQYRDQLEALESAKASLVPLFQSPKD